MKSMKSRKSMKSMKSRKSMKSMKSEQNTNTEQNKTVPFSRTRSDSEHKPEHVQKTNTNKTPNTNRRFSEHRTPFSCNPDFYNSSIKMGREQSHRIDLRLISHMEAVILKIYLTKVILLSKSTFLTSNKRSRKVKKGPAAPKPICCQHLRAGIVLP